MEEVERKLKGEEIAPIIGIGLTSAASLYLILSLISLSITHKIIAATFVVCGIYLTKISIQKYRWHKYCYENHQYEIVTDRIQKLSYGGEDNSPSVFLENAHQYVITTNRLIKNLQKGQTVQVLYFTEEDKPFAILSE